MCRKVKPHVPPFYREDHGVRFWMVEQTIVSHYPQTYLAVNIYLKSGLSFWERLRLGLAYIFGLGEQPGSYALHIIPHQQALELRAMIDHYEVRTLAETQCSVQTP